MFADHGFFTTRFILRDSAMCQRNAIRWVGLALAVAPILLLASLTIGCLPLGQRLLNVEIEVDGVKRFEGIVGVPDSTSKKAMWNSVDDVEFRAVTPNDAPNLECDIVVRILHTKHELTSSRCKQLRLMPGDAKGTFFLDRETTAPLRDRSVEH